MFANDFSNVRDWWRFTPADNFSKGTEPRRCFDGIIRNGWVGLIWESRHIIKTFITCLVFGTSELRNFKLTVKELCNGRCPWDVIIRIPYRLYAVKWPNQCGYWLFYGRIRVCYIHIGVGSALLVLLLMAMRRPRCAGQANDQFPRFFYAVTYSFVLIVLLGERKIYEKHWWWQHWWIYRFYLTLLNMLQVV